MLWSEVPHKDFLVLPHLERMHLILERLEAQKKGVSRGIRMVIMCKEIRVWESAGSENGNC